MEEKAEGEEVREIVLLVSPLCPESLETAVKLRKLASMRGYSFREVSALESEGLKMIEDFGIKRVPAAIMGGRLLFQGRVPENLESLLER